MREEVDRRFDLEQGPLIRGQLIRLAEQEHVLLIIMHHIVSDGWSLGVLRHELSTLYRAYSSGEEDPLPRWGPVCRLRALATTTADAMGIRNLFLS